MNLKSLKTDLCLLLLLIFFVFLLFFAEKQTNLIDDIRNEIFLKLAYFSKLRLDIKDFFKDFEKIRKGKTRFLNMDESEVFKSLAFYYRNKYKQLLELNGFSFKNDFLLSRLLDIKYTQSGIEYVLEANDASKGSIVVDLKLRRIIGIVETSRKGYCIAIAPGNKNFSLPVDIKINEKRFLGSVLKGDGTKAFIDIFEKNIDLNGGKVSLSINHKLYSTLDEIDCTYIGEINPIPVEKNGYKVYKIQTCLPKSEYLLIVRW